MYYVVTHNQKPPEGREIGPFFEWSPANDWAQEMSAADAQTFMSTTAHRELTFAAVDDDGTPLPTGYPLAPDTAIPDGAIIVLKPSSTGPIRTIVYQHQLSHKE